MRAENGRDTAWPVALVDDFPVGLAQVDHVGLVIKANARFALLLGLDPAEVAGTDLNTIAWPPADADVSMGPGAVQTGPGHNLLHHLLAGHPVDAMFSFTPADGSTVELRMRGVPSAPGISPSGASLVLTDVPDTVATQHSANRDAEAYRMLADHVADIVLVTEQGTMTWVSPSVRRILGLDPGDLIGRPVTTLIHPRDKRPPTVTPEAPTAAVRHRLRTAEGSYKWFDTNITASFAPDGTELARYGVARDIEERRHYEGLMAASEQRFREALDASPDGFAIYHVERGQDSKVTGMRLISINAAGALGFAGDPAMLIGRNLLEFYPEARDNGLYRDLLVALETGAPQQCRIESVGESWTGYLDGVQVRLDHETVMSTWRDVTENVHREHLLERAYQETAEVRATLQTALDATSDGFIIFELERDEDALVTGLRAVHANAAATAPLGLSPDDALGQDPREIYPWFESSGLWEKTLAAVAEMSPREHRVHLDDADGEWVQSIDNTIAPVGDDRIVLTFRDVTDDERTRRSHEDSRREAEHAATHDALTGLPNRLLLRRRLQEALTGCGPEEQVAVVFCDLDGFKLVNDTYGHAAGDAVLQATADRLQHLMRRDDTAARLAGDEFVLVLRHVPPGWSTDDFVARATKKLSEPLWFDEVLLTPSASLGLVVAAGHESAGTDKGIDAILAAADEAMYTAKEAGRGRS